MKKIIWRRGPPIGKLSFRFKHNLIPNNFLFILFIYYKNVVMVNYDFLKIAIIAVTATLRTTVKVTVTATSPI